MFPTPPPQQAAEQTDPSPVELLQSMLELATVYQNVERDQDDKLSMQRATTLLQGLLAKDQADQEQLLGGNARAIRRLA